MADESAFGDFLKRIRAGDEAATTELFRKYEPVLRRLVRLRVTDPRLFRLLESGDVCQSVLASFFVRAAAGQYDLEGPDQLHRLLLDMARKKLASAVRKHQAQRRDDRRQSDTPLEEIGLGAADPSPSRIVAGRELLERVRANLHDEERALADRRAEGRSWQEIADELGGAANARRMQLTRGLNRVTAELGIDDDLEGTT